MKFAVEVTETLARIVRIEAATSDEAIEKVRQLYRNSDIVLDSSDFVDVDFSAEATVS